MTSFWTPPKDLQGETCYILGGGSSLKSFDFSLLEGKNVIGCNVAYMFGAELVPYVVFADAPFLKDHMDGLSDYVAEGGNVVTNSKQKFGAPEWLKMMERVTVGLSRTRLAFGGSTGGAAAHLALLRGAKTVYLLGFDMQVGTGGETNYHDKYKGQVASDYRRFVDGISTIAYDMRMVYPDRQIVNLEDGTSTLECFKKESLKEHFTGKAVSYA